MEQRIRKLIEDGERLFSNKGTLDQFHQEIALNFYPEMAEFTNKRYLGEEFADHLTTSYPIIARRTLGNSIAAILRPVQLDNTSQGVWFSIASSEDNRRLNQESLRWLDYATGVQRRAMYDRLSGFTRATKEADHQFVSFGNAPISLNLNARRDTLIYRCWHLRDMAWVEDQQGEICTTWRKWKTTLSEAATEFGKNAGKNILDKVGKNPYEEVEIWHIVIRTDKYEQRDRVGKRWRTPWVSVFVDVSNEHLIQEIGSESRIYIIPRWVTVPGCQYASSPAVTAALPDARLIQSMTLTLLEASEKFADPPMAATQEAIRSDANLYAGGVTWIDSAYDERLGAAIRPIYQPTAGQNIAAGLNMRADIREMIDKAFYLDSLSLPPATTKEMTAFEVGERISEWIRRAMPIFEPLEYEYNAVLCEETFDLLMRNGAFGPFEDMPQELRGEEIAFKFESPLHKASGRQKGQAFLEAKAALAEAAQLDPSTAQMLDATVALRDVLNSIGSPPDWVRSKSEVEQLARQAQAEQMDKEFAQASSVSSEIAANLGSAAKDFAAAGAPA